MINNKKELAGAKIDNEKELILKELPEAKDYLNDLNIYDYLNVIEEKNNCKQCKGLDYCKNVSQGYYTSCNGNKFFLEKCQFKILFDDKNSLNSLIKTLYMPQSIKNASFDNYYLDSESRNKIFKEVNAFLTDIKNGVFHKGLYLVGNFSIGKTYTLACIQNELAKIGVESLLIYFPDLVLQLKNSMKELSYHQLINKLKEVDVLMLDDLGSENMTPWLRDEVLGPVLNYRALEKKPLFISTNLDPLSMQEHFMCGFNTNEDEIKAKRLFSRFESIIRTINMNDSKKISR